MNLLWNYLRPHRGKAILLAVCVVAAIGFQLTTPQILSRFIDAATKQQPTHDLIGLAVLFWGVAAASYLVNILRTYLKENVAWRTTNALRNDLARHCLNLDMTFHHTHAPGELIERIDGDVAKLARFFSELFLIAVSNALLLVGVLVALWLEDWRVGVAFTGFAGLALTMLYTMRNIAQKDFEEARQTEAAMFGFIEERLSGTEDIRANGGDIYTMNRLFGVMRTFAHASIGASEKIIRLRVATMMLFSFGSICAVALGVFLFTSGIITLGTVYLIYAYVRMLLAPIERLVLELQEFQTASASLKRIQELLEIQPTIRDGHLSLPDGKLGVEFRNVRFGYTDDTSLLDNFSFELTAGRTLGLLGRTGSGKTTIARLLLRFYEAQEGHVLLNRVDVRDVKLDSLRDKIALVTQDVQIFNATVRDNLTLFDPSIPDARLMATIDELCLRKWFDRLDHGLDTMLEANGLSAGEAQLVAFARVFLRNPQIVILDEASSRIDPETQHIIDLAVSRLLKGRTGIIIAHRLATVQRVDEIMVLREGRIIEHGERELLMANARSIFAEMVEAA